MKKILFENSKNKIPNYYGRSCNFSSPEPGYLGWHFFGITLIMMSLTNKSMGVGAQTPQKAPRWPSNVELNFEW